MVTDYYDPSGANVLFGDAGNDLVEGGQGNDEVYGGPGDDQVSGYGGNDDVRGYEGNDTLHGNDGDDLVTDYYDPSGANVLFGDAGDDLVEGGQGNDEVYGGPGDDQVYGYAGNDRLLGGPGNDALYGGHGLDGLFGGIDDPGDQLNGQGGADRYLLKLWLPFGSEDSYSLESSDAIVWFASGNKSWTNEEIEQIDDGFKLLHERTRNTQLLKLANSNSFVLWRYDDLGPNRLADNDSQGTIRVADIAFSQDPNTDTPRKRLDPRDWPQLGRSERKLLGARLSRTEHRHVPWP